MAEKIGEKPDTIRHWKHRGKVPETIQVKLVTAFPGGVSLNDFPRIHSEIRTERGDAE